MNDYDLNESIQADTRGSHQYLIHKFGELFLEKVNDRFEKRNLITKITDFMEKRMIFFDFNSNPKSILLFCTAI